MQDACALEDPSKLVEVVHSQLRKGVQSIIVGGGDGTLRTVGGVLAHTEATMGVLPLGTVNDFVRNLGIEPTIEAACKVIAAGNTAAVDLGQANDDHFLITDSIGFSAQSQLALKPELKKMFGPFGYLVASLLALRHLRDLKVTVRHEESEECVDALQVGVIKGHYWMGGKVEIPNIYLTTDAFAFYAVPARQHRSFLNTAWHLQHGDFFHMPGLRAFATADVTFETSTSQPLVLDGDICGKTPVHLKVLRNALRVYVPAEFPKTKTPPPGNPG